MRGILDELDVDGATQQSRISRLLLAFVEADEVLAAAVLAEIATDERGERVAYSGVLIGLVSGLVDMWTRSASPATIAEQLRRGLAELELEES